MHTISSYALPVRANATTIVQNAVCKLQTKRILPVCACVEKTGRKTSSPFMVLLADIPSSGHQRSQRVSEPWGHVEEPEEREGHMYW